MHSVGNRCMENKKISTHLSMEMHSRRVCLRTHVDRKQKRLFNAVDVVVHLRDLPDQVPNARHLRVLHTFSSVSSSPS